VVPGSRFGERGLSPVVGAVLLVAIATILAGLGAAVAFELTDRKEPAPEVILDLEGTDAPVAHALAVDSGEALRGENVELRGVADESGFSGRLAAGESVTVYPVADTVRVVWFGEYGTSYVLARFDPDPALPAADEGCNWVESTTGGAISSVTVDVVVDCDVKTEGGVDVVDPGVVIGDVDSYSNGVDMDGGEVYGTVDAETSVDLDETLVAAAVAAGGDVTVTDGSTVEGSVTTGPSGSIDIDGDSAVAGSLSAGDDLALDDVTVGGDVSAPDVDIDDSTVDGAVHATGSLSLDGATVDGHVYAPAGSVSCSDSTIAGQDCSAYTPRDPDEYDG
jgi:flagellin-like protein